MKSTLAANRFKTHNNKSKELVASKFHSTLRNVRIVINTGIDKNTGNPIKGKSAQFKAVFINNQSQWRTIATGSTFKGTGYQQSVAVRFGSALTAIEVGAEEASTCKRCGTKNFKAKSGNVVCANACWTRWAGRNSKTDAKRRNAAASTHNAAATKAALARAASRTAVKRPDERKQIADHYATITVGQLVKIVQDSGEVSPFVGMVTQVKSVSGRPHELLKNVSVQWMHNGVTESLTNYCKPGIVSWLEVVS
jgi:uncharacterized Zn finger protein (UPF0148 family)